MFRWNLEYTGREPICKWSNSVTPYKYLPGISRPLDIVAAPEPPLPNRARILHPRVGEHGRGVVVISPVFGTLKFMIYRVSTVGAFTHSDIYLLKVGLKGFSKEFYTNLEEIALAVRPPGGGSEVGRDTGPTLQNSRGPRDQRFKLQVEVPEDLALKEVELPVLPPQ